MLISTAEFARLCGVTRTTVGNWIQEGLPKASRGRIDDATGVQWAIARANMRADRRIEELDRDEADARKKRLEGDKLEIELRKLRGELVPIERVLLFIERMVIAFKSRLLAFPTKAAARMIALETMQEARDILETEVHQVLHDLTSASIDISDLRTGGPDAPPPAQGSGPAAPADAKPVGGRKGHALRRRKRRAGKVPGRSS